MAVYYKWIKGCYPKSNLTTGTWSYMQWGEKDEQTTNALPHLYVCTGRDGTKQNLGYFLTNDVANVEIEQVWSFDTNLGAIKFGENSKIRKNQLIGSWIATTGSNENDSFSFDLQTFFNKPLTAKSTSIFEDDSHFKKKIVADGTITGLSFNATSDRRAKENIQPANYSALDLIQKLPIYIYNYKNNNETVTGVMAQDLLEIQPKELDLVSNTTATGENGDYMSIKNDKLMFVLMKAIQEQQEKINYLEEELNKLKNN